MRRSKLIEYGIVFTGLIFGYKFVEELFSTILQLVMRYFGSYGDIGSFIGYSLFFAALYGILFVTLIRKSKDIAIYLTKNQDNEVVPVKINRSALLHVTLVGLSAYTILSNLPGLLVDIYDFFEHEVGHKVKEELTYNNKPTSHLRIEIVQIAVAAVILAYSRSISHWFIQKDELENLTFDTTPEN